MRTWIKLLVDKFGLVPVSFAALSFILFFRTIYISLALYLVIYFILTTFNLGGPFVYIIIFTVLQYLSVLLAVYYTAKEMYPDSIIRKVSDFINEKKRN